MTKKWEKEDNYVNENEQTPQLLWFPNTSDRKYMKGHPAPIAMQKYQNKVRYYLT